MDIKHILEKLSEIDAKQTLLESTSSANVAPNLVVDTTPSMSFRSVYEQLVSEVLSERVTYNPDGTRTPSFADQMRANAAQPGAGIPNPTPNLNVTPPAATAPAAPAAPAPATAPAAGGVANPYQGADAAKFAALSPQDQAWLTKGGGKPDINDEIILSRAPNKGKPTAPAQQAASPAAAPAAPAAPAAQKVDPNQADNDDAEMGAAMRANAAGGNSTSAATGVGIPGEEAAAPVATTSPVKPQTPPQVTTTSPAAPATAAADPAAPAVTANPTANPAVTPAKAPYKGSAGAQEIQKLNPAIKDVNKIQPGQALKMPDGSTYTVKPGDTLDRIAKGVKPAVTQQDRIDKAPPAATPPTVRGPTQPAATPPAAPAAPFRKELDIDRIKQLSGAPAKPGKVDLSVTNPAMNPVNNTTPAPAAKPTTTSTNTSVSGTMKMGKPDGPIQYNGKTVNPGQPEYAAASQALMTQQGRIQQVRQGMQPGGGGAPKLSTAPVAQGATNADRADFESVRNIDDAILERIRSALKF